MVPFKLRLVAERWGFLLNADDPKRLVMRKDRGRTNRGDPRSTALEVIVYRPLPSSAEYIVIGTWTGPMDAEGLPKAQEELTGLMEQLRGDLQNLEERRRHPRYPFDAPVLIFPQYSDGVVDQPIPGVCRDISQGGVRFLAAKPVRTDRAYIEFKGIEPVGAGGDPRETGANDIRSGRCVDCRPLPNVTGCGIIPLSPELLKRVFSSQPPMPPKK